LPSLRPASCPLFWKGADSGKQGGGGGKKGGVEKKKIRRVKKEEACFEFPGGGQRRKT